MTEYSTNPAGEGFPLPEKHEYAAELQRLEVLARRARDAGQEVVVVMGVGFVGAVMAAIVADSTDEAGRSTKFVIGCQRPSPRSYWKIPMLNRGVSPVKAEDPTVDLLIRRCVQDKETLTATYNSDCLTLADCVVVDVQCDYVKRDLGNLRTGEVDMAALEATLRTIGERIPPDCLTLIETTVAPGTTEFVAWPILKKAFARRGLTATPLLAHSYERVLNTATFPLTILDRPIESETAKIVENSYRATTLAFLNEWSLFAERNGVDLIKVIKAIKVRPTHSNIIFPGPGIGGYCLPKDGGLGYWAYKHILGFDDGDAVFKMSTTAIDINDTRGLHVATLARDALRNMGRYIAGAQIALCGASYRQDVGDTRYSGSEVVVRRLTEMGADVRVHDPYVEHWYEFESQDTYPAPGQSLARFFRNQEHLVDLRVQSRLEDVIRGAEAVILAVPHEPYLRLKPEDVVGMAGAPLAVIDCFGILDDAAIRRYFELGCEVKGLGRGHIQRLKAEQREAR